MRAGSALALSICAGAVFGACRPDLTLGPSYPPNRAGDLRHVARRLQSAAEVARPARIYLVTDDPGGIAAFEPGAGRVIWRIEAPVLSRVEAQGPVLVYLTEDRQLEGRATATGDLLWRKALAGSGELLGLATDGEHVYYALAEDLEPGAAQASGLSRRPGCSSRSTRAMGDAFGGARQPVSSVHQLCGQVWSLCLFDASRSLCWTVPAARNWLACCPTRRHCYG